ncbi:hypothetical protein F5877DRAFT_72946 [Lentinula edodes]|nr:hypothetical protein F5877DRAFT_72946 [Lentinula edodes]
MMLYNVRLVPGKGKPKPMPVTFVGRVLSSANNTGMLGNYVASKNDPKYVKRTAFLGRPFDEGFITDWDTTISTFTDLITLLSKEQGTDVAYLWQDDDVVTNDGTFRFGHPLFRVLKPNEQKDSKILPIVPNGKETSTFWMRAVDGFALAKFPAVDINGNSIPNEDVQSVIEGATVAIDAVVRGWKFKTDKRWGFALDIKRLTVLHAAEEEQELELPSLLGSQGTVSTDNEKLNIDCLPRTEGDGTVALGENLGGDTAATTEVAHAVTEDVRKARKGKAPTTPVSNKRRGSPLAKPSGEKQLVHGKAGTGKTYLAATLYEYIRGCCSDNIVFKGAATPHSASLIGGISVETLPPEAAVNDKQQYFLLDCGNGLDMNILASFSHRLNDIHNYNDTSTLFGGKSVIVFSDFYQQPPLTNPSSAMWFLRGSTSALSYEFIDHCHQLTVPVVTQSCNCTNLLCDRIRDCSVSEVDWKFFNSNVLSPEAFVCHTSSHKSVVITSSRSRSIEWNSHLPRVVTAHLHKTLYICNVDDTVYFGLSSSLDMKLVDQWLTKIANTGSILGRIPIFIGMRCTIVIDSTLIWGTVHDIVLDSREMVPALRPDVVQLRYPPKEITVYLAPELLRWNPNLDEVLHIKPVTTRYMLPPVFPSMAEGEITRTQIPIAPLFAALEHEVAGQHFTSILIDMKDGLKEFSNLYSVLSRVETGGQCWITEQAKFERFEVYSPIVHATLHRSANTLCKRGVM